MIIARKKHTAGDRRRFVVDYGDWLDDGDRLLSGAVTGDSDTAPINDVVVLEGRQVVFFVNDGVVKETFTATVVAISSTSEIKTDEIVFTVV